MKVEELRLLLKDIVRETMREELREILTEAVQIASTPETQQPRQKIQFQTPSWVTEMQQQHLPKSPVPAHPEMGKGHDTMMEMLQATANNMTSQDLSNFM